MFGEYSDYCSHLRLISQSEKCSLDHVNNSFEVYGVELSCWNHWWTLTTSFLRPSTVQNLRNRSVLIVTQCSLSLSNQKALMMACLKKEIQAVQFRKAFTDSAEGMFFPRRSCFWSSYEPTTENLPRLKTRHCQAHFWALVNQTFFIVYI